LNDPFASTESWHHPGECAKAAPPTSGIADSALASRF
jgi:hypothetical protein